MAIGPTQEGASGAGNAGTSATTNPGPPDEKGIRRTIELTGALLGLLALALYAVGWSFLAEFYGAFSVEPEEAGRDWQWIVARGVIVALLPLALVGCGGALLGAAPTVAAWLRRRPPVDRWLGALGAAVVGLAAAYAVVGITVSVGTSRAGWGNALLIGVGLAAGGYAAVTPRWVLLALAAAAAVIGLLGTSGSLAATYADRVKASEELSFKPFVLLPTVLEVPQVRVYAPQQPLLHNSCVGLLGVGPRSVLLFAQVPNTPLRNPADEVWRLAPGAVQLVFFTNGTCEPAVGYIDKGWPADRPDTKARY
jgi:MFS family permease